MKNSIRKISRNIFFVCMIICALLGLIAVWGVFDAPGFSNFAPIIPSLFIIGLASFLIWLVLTIQEVRDKIIGKK